MKSLSLIACLAFVSIHAAEPASAKTFQTSYLSMTIPDQFTCTQSSNAWVCLSSDLAHAKDAVIVLSAKVAAPEDNLAAFASQYRRSKTLTASGAPIESKVISVQNKNLSGTQWVQAQQLGSEVPDFYTLYLATVKDQISIQVSFSAEKSKYAAYSTMFNQAIQSIKLLNMPKIQNAPAVSPVIPTTSLPAGQRSKTIWPWIGLLAIVLASLATLSIFMTGRKKISRRKSERNRPK
jgi:hypothetical protein